MQIRPNVLATLWQRYGNVFEEGCINVAVPNQLWVTPDRVTQTESHVETDVLLSRRCLTHGGTVIKSTKGKITKQKGNPN